LLDLLIPCLADALASDDWATRKAASETLTHVAAISNCHLLSGFKSSYFSSFQARRFDKVKIVRESINQMLEAWKDVPGVLGDEEDHGTNSSPSQSRSSSARRESESDGRLVGSRTSGSARSSSPHTLKKNRSPISSRSPPIDASPTPAARRRTPPRNDKRTSPPQLHNVDHRKTPDWKIEIAIPRGPPFAVMCKDEHQNDRDRDEAAVCDQGLGPECLIESDEESELA
ncbi:hypothetical protein Taro_021996, partial [Colocasia esculenta]|nr:hypothetical protein [Colocasia esculenta]